MKKYIANIEISGPVTDFTLCVDGVCTIPDDGTEFYLASEVDEFLAGINEADDARDEVIRKEIAAKDARIGELEKALHEALTTMEATAERLTGSSIKVDDDSPIAKARKALRLDP